MWGFLVELFFFCGIIVTRQLTSSDVYLIWSKTRFEALDGSTWSGAPWARPHGGALGPMVPMGVPQAPRLHSGAPSAPLVVNNKSSNSFCISHRVQEEKHSHYLN